MGGLPSYEGDRVWNLRRISGREKERKLGEGWQGITTGVTTSDP